MNNPTNYGKWSIHAFFNGAWHQFYKAETLICAKSDLASILARTETGVSKITAARICYGNNHPSVRSGKTPVGTVREARNKT